MVMVAPMRMRTGPAHMPFDAKLLTLTQWLSPAYPVGAFAWSHGLETAVAQGWVVDARSLQGWLHDLLTDGSGRSDAVAITLAHVAGSEAEVTQIDRQCRAYAPSVERLAEADRQGAAFARVTREVWKLEMPDCLLPVALGRAARLLDLPRETAVALYLQGFVSNLVAAAQRLMPLGQSAAQGVVAALIPRCVALAADTADSGPDDLYSNCFLSDIAAMRHEIQQPRLFQS